MTDAADDVSKPASKDADDQESHIKDRSPDGKWMLAGRAVPFRVRSARGVRVSCNMTKKKQ
jgi:hypothetical protein